MQKIFIVYINLNIIPSLITVPSRESPVQTLRGVIRWTTPDWRKDEYELIEQKINTNLMNQCDGLELFEVIDLFANMLLQELPDRNFSINIGSFGIERKVETKSEEGS